MTGHEFTDAEMVLIDACGRCNHTQAVHLPYCGSCRCRVYVSPSPEKLRRRAAVILERNKAAK